MRYTRNRLPPRAAARYTRNRLPPRAAALFLLAFAAAGCGRSGNVTGEVKFEGVPLTGGWVTLNYAGGKPSPVSGAIGPDGAYHINGCPTGDVRVTIRPPRGRGNTPGKPKQAAFPIRYAVPERTDVKATVECGSQRLDLDLKP